MPKGRQKGRANTCGIIYNSRISWCPHFQKICQVKVNIHNLTQQKEDVSFSDLSKQAEVGGSLKVIIQSLPSISIEGEASVNINETEKILTQDLEVSFAGDTILEQPVSSFNDTVQVYKQFSCEALKSQNIRKFSLSPIENYCEVITSYPCY